jgi:hypothetical protein
MNDAVPTPDKDIEVGSKILRVFNLSYTPSGPSGHAGSFKDDENKDSYESIRNYLSGVKVPVILPPKTTPPAPGKLEAYYYRNPKEKGIPDLKALESEGIYLKDIDVILKDKKKTEQEKSRMTGIIFYAVYTTGRITSSGLQNVMLEALRKMFPAMTIKILLVKPGVNEQRSTGQYDLPGSTETFDYLSINFDVSSKTYSKENNQIDYATIKRWITDSPLLEF